MELKGKAVLITGSSSGIGREAAYKFAKEGAKIAITYNKGKEDALKAAETCRELGAADTLVLHLDVTDNESIKKAVRETVRRFGKISVLVNNAGVATWEPLEKLSNDDIESQMRINLEGLIKVTREALPHMQDSIINIASGAGKSGFRDLSVYCATKFGVRGFTQSLAQELSKVKVYSVNPGTTATRMTGFRGVAAEKVADIIVRAAKDGYGKKSGSDIDVCDPRLRMKATLVAFFPIISAADISVAASYVARSLKARFRRYYG